MGWVPRKVFFLNHYFIHLEQLWICYMIPTTEKGNTARSAFIRCENQIMNESWNYKLSISLSLLWSRIQVWKNWILNNKFFPKICQSIFVCSSLGFGTRSMYQMFVSVFISFFFSLFRSFFRKSGIIIAFGVCLLCAYPWLINCFFFFLYSFPSNFEQGAMRKKNHYRFVFYDSIWKRFVQLIVVLSDRFAADRIKNEISLGLLQCKSNSLMMFLSLSHLFEKNLKRIDNRTVAPNTECETEVKATIIITIIEQQCN